MAKTITFYSRKHVPVASVWSEYHDLGDKSKITFLLNLSKWCEEQLKEIRTVEADQEELTSKYIKLHGETPSIGSYLGTSTEMTHLFTNDGTWVNV